MINPANMEVTCQRCGQVLNRHKAVGQLEDDTSLEEKYYVFCAHCELVNVVDPKTMEVREATKDETKSVKQHIFKLYQHAIKNPRLN